MLPGCGPVASSSPRSIGRSPSGLVHRGSGAAGANAALFASRSGPRPCQGVVRRRPVGNLTVSAACSPRFAGSPGACLRPDRPRRWQPRLRGHGQRLAVIEPAAAGQTLSHGAGQDRAQCAGDDPLNDFLAGVWPDPRTVGFYLIAIPTERMFNGGHTEFSSPGRGPAFSFTDRGRRRINPHLKTDRAAAAMTNNAPHNSSACRPARADPCAEIFDRNVGMIFFPRFR